MVSVHQGNTTDPNLALQSQSHRYQRPLAPHHLDGQVQLDLDVFLCDGNEGKEFEYVIYKTYE